MMPPSPPRDTATRHHRTVALAGVTLVATMFGAAFAAVPLYEWFCKVTGVGGTTQVALSAPVRPIEREITVRFDTNVRQLPWRFTAPAPVTARIGEMISVTYVVENTGTTATSGTAVYNVVPLITGSYFNKMQCFCFTEQKLAAGERLEMPVVFFVDPAIAADKDGAGVSTITLSYTFYPTAKPTAPLAAAPAAATRL